MNENIPDIDKLFKDSIEGHAEMPPPHVWNELDARLDKKNMASIAGKYNKLKWVAAALFIFSIGMAMYAYLVHRNTEMAANSALKGHVTSSGGERVPATVMPQPSEIQRRHGKALPDQQPAAVLNQLGKAAPDQQPLHAQAAAAEPAATESMPPEEDLVVTEKASRRAVTGKKSGMPEKMAPVNEKQQQHARPAFSPGPSLAGNNPALTPQTRTIEAAVISNGPEKHDDTALATDPLMPLAYHSIFTDSIFDHASPYMKLTPAQPHRGITVTAFFSPDLVASQVKSDRPHYSREDNRKEINDKEQSGFSWSAGALFDYRLSPRWSVGSGLVLSTRVTQIESKTVYAHPDEHGDVKYRFSCSSGYTFIDLKQNRNPFDGDSANAVSSTSRLQYLSVPLVVKYNFGQGNLQFITGAGLQANFLTSRKIETVISRANTKEGARSTDIQGLRSMYMSGILNAGLSYRVSSVFSASLVPAAQIGLSSINRNAPVKSSLTFYGLAAGISMKL